MIHIRIIVKTAIHDGMPTFFIVTSSNLIGLDWKTFKKIKIQGTFCLIF